MSWLSKTRVNGLFAAVSSVFGSKPDVDAPTGAVTVSEAPAPTDAPAEGDAPAEPDGATLGVVLAGALGATDDDADGLPDAELDGIGVADGAGAYVQPGGALAEQAAMAAVAARMARAIVRRRIFSRTSEHELDKGATSCAGNTSTPNLPSAAASCRAIRSDPSGIAGQPEPDRDRGRLDPAGYAELGQDIADVDADRLLADEQPLADLAVCPALGHQGQHLVFAL